MVEHLLNDRLLQFVGVDLHDVKEARKRFDKANVIYDQGLGHSDRIYILCRGTWKGISKIWDAFSKWKGISKIWDAFSKWKGISKIWDAFSKYIFGEVGKGDVTTSEVLMASAFRILGSPVASLFGVSI
ncbi:hypothetical protein U1Q18_006977 [Sarracenia purpurea var. burkii]